MSFSQHGRFVAPVTRISLLVSSTAVALLVGLLAPTASSAGAASAENAEETLERVLSLLEDTPRSTALRTDLSLELNELRQALPRLGAEDQARAEALLGRPTNQSLLGGGDGIISVFPLRHTALCDSVVCVRYTTTGAHATTAAHAQAAFAAARQVHLKYRGAGYRPPLSDANARDDGGGPQTDIYIGDVGGQAGYYGYCASDEGGRRTWAYCVVDNDYQASEFDTRNTPVEKLRVTMAHELFHAVQYGYDAAESRWFMESTATWAEDEVFDSVNDNVAYLSTSPLARPNVPLNASSPALFPYGSWIFYGHLATRHPRSTGGMPNIVRAFWANADAVPGAPNLSGLEAVRQVLARVGDFESSIARFGAANRRSRSTYPEGARQRYPVAPLAKAHRIAPRRGVKGSLRLAHLSTGTVRAVPTTAMKDRRWKLTVQVRSGAVRSVEAIVTVRRKPRGFITKRVRLNSAGRGRATVPFSRGQVSWVEVTMANAHPTENGIGIGYRLRPHF